MKKDFSIKFLKQEKYFPDYYIDSAYYLLSEAQIRKKSDVTKITLF